MKNKKLIGHMMTLFTILIWSSTFISSKILLRDLSPTEIMVYRFTLAYLALWLFHPKKHSAISLKDEISFLILGLTGVTLYFLAENNALILTTVSNVGLLITLAPILTILLAHFMHKEKVLTLKTWFGFILSMVGVFFVMFNGRFISSIHPMGDGLALIAAAIWAIYSNVLKEISVRYPSIIIVRKSFFYGMISLVPLVIILKDNLLPTYGFSPTIIGHLLFLSLLASALCYLLWNIAINYIGIVKTSNYIYLIPLITMLLSWLILGEVINLIMIIGGVFIIFGVYISERS